MLFPNSLVKKIREMWSSSSRDNWERLVAAVLKRHQIWELCHQQSRTPSICSTISSNDDDLSEQSLSFSGTNFGPYSVPTSPPHPSISPVRTAAVSNHGYANVIKDLFLFLKGENEDIRDLSERLRAPRITLATIISRKEDIDRSLRTDVTKKKSNQYEVMEKEFVFIFKQYNKFIRKHARITGDSANMPFATTELGDSSMALVMEKFKEIESKMLTFNYFKLAKLSRDIAKLDERASRFLRSLQDPKHMMDSSAEPYQEKLFDDDSLPVFGEYVATVLRHLSRKTNCVGITGPPGVGKTTVMWKLYNQLMNKKSLDGFDFVIWIQDVGAAADLQTEIMLQLQIRYEKTDSVLMNANNISAFLRNRKYILLMDHVSKEIDLNNLGVRGDHQNGNVVIASSNRKALSVMIKDEVEIKRLNHENALVLFESICGKVNYMHEEIAQRIIQCCGGLPRVIKSVATYLKGHPDESSWMYTKKILQSITRPANLYGLAGFDLFYKERFKELEMSYMKCFLYVALFRNEDKIHKDYLIECWMAECFIENDYVVQKLRDSRDLGQGILDQLTQVFLLEWCLDRKYVRMPSICRRMALQQGYPGEEKGLVLVPSDDVKIIIEERTWKTVRRLSLIHSETELPESPECSNIYTLILCSKPELVKIPDSFFLHMHHLLVLDVSDTNIQLLPSSIGKLVNLKCLYLNSCKYLETLPPEAADLKKLQILDIHGTSIPSLPQVIANMIELRCLRASISPGVIIPLNIIKNLKKLEELCIDTGIFSPSEDLAEEFAKEIASLEYLTTLRFNFPNLSSFNTFVSQSKSLKNKDTIWESSTFRSFKIFVGRCHETQQPYESDVQEILAERRLRFSVNEEEFSSACQELSKQASAFELIGNQSVETLSQFDLHSVQVCVVGNCTRLKNIEEAGNRMNELQEIVEESSGGVLKNLRKLHLYDLPLLRCVWGGSVSNIVDESLVNLIVLTLNGCPKLTKIFDFALARRLPCLKRLKVDNCSNVSEIVQVPKESSASELADLPDLLNSVETIELINLTNLKSICSSTSLSWNSLNSIVITRCRKVINVSLTETNAKRLASIDCEKVWWNHLPLADAVNRRLLPLCRFQVEVVR